MMERKYNLHDGKSGAAITVRVTPRSRQTEISEILDDGTIKVRLAKTQNEEKSNQELIAFLAGVLETEPKNLEIVAGLSGNDKLITITGMDKGLVQERILKNIA